MENLLNEAAGAAARQDMRGLYQVVRKLAPKQEYKRVQIHSKNGEILTPGEEIAELKVFFTNVYSGDTCTMEFEAPCVAPHCCGVGIRPWQSSRHEGRSHMLCTSSIMETLCASPGEVLHQLLSELWNGRAPTVPQLWKDCWITLLAKPGKRSKRPESLRPIALQCVGGKTVLRTICQAIKPAVYQYLKQVPQYAYMACRDGVMALLRAFNHCGQVKLRCLISGLTELRATVFNNGLQLTLRVQHGAILASDPRKCSRGLHGASFLTCVYTSRWSPCFAAAWSLLSAA